MITRNWRNSEQEVSMTKIYSIDIIHVFLVKIWLTCTSREKGEKHKKLLWFPRNEVFQCSIIVSDRKKYFHLTERHYLLSISVLSIPIDFKYFHEAVSFFMLGVSQSDLNRYREISLAFLTVAFCSKLFSIVQTWLNKKIIRLIHRWGKTVNRL